MDCLLPLIHRLIDLTNHPLGFFLLTHNLYSDFANSYRENYFLHALPALVLMGAVAYRLYHSKEVDRICEKLRCKIHKNLYFICNIFCAQWLLNMTLVSFLSLQDFVYCTTRSYCDQPTFPASLWAETSSCMTAPSNVGVAIISGVAFIGALILWQPDVLLGYVGDRIKQRHELVHWMIAKIKPRFEAPAAKPSGENSQVDNGSEK